MASFIEQEGEAFDVMLRMADEPEKSIVIQFENYAELESLALYLLMLAKKLEIQKVDMKEGVGWGRCGSCFFYGITDTGFGMCRKHQGRVASDSCICNDYEGR